MGAAKGHTKPLARQVTWLEFGQPDPELRLDEDGAGTVRLMLLDRPDDKWRAEFNVRAASVAVPVTAVAVELWTALEVRVGGYDANRYPVDIFRTLSEAVGLLESGAWLPSEPADDIPLSAIEGWDGSRYLATAVQSWWQAYKSVGTRNCSPLESATPLWADVRTLR